jgi:hypothetical protein
VYAPTAVDRAADGLVDPQVAVLRMAGGGIATCEVFVRSGIGYEVRCEVSAERGNATVGLGGGVLVRAANRWGGAVPDDFRERFAAAYDAEVRAWVDACRRGEVVGPTTWDGYAAAAVCEAGVASLHSGSPVPVRLEAADPPRSGQAQQRRRRGAQHHDHQERAPGAPGRPRPRRARRAVRPRSAASRRPAPARRPAPPAAPPG